MYSFIFDKLYENIKPFTFYSVKEKKKMIKYLLQKTAILPPELKGKRKNFKMIFFVLFLGIAIFSLEAQTPENGKVKNDKSRLTIKPNSRDITVVVRNNNFQRINRQRNQIMIQKMQHLRQKKLMKKSIDQSRRQEMMQRRQQMIQQRKSVRR